MYTQSKGPLPGGFLTKEVLFLGSFRTKIHRVACIVQCKFKQKQVARRFCSLARKYRMAQLGAADALSELTTTIKEFNREHIPLPAELTGKGCIECFFRHFERYARSLYKENTGSYLKLLPQFLRGKAYDVVISFGYANGISYEVVRERIIKVLNDRKGLGSNAFAETLTMSREPGENLTCFSIRLQVAAENFTVPSCSIPFSLHVCQNLYLGR